jgi:outer membrane protein OmpA-like peptidoglycan-associated protein
MRIVSVAALGLASVACGASRPTNELLSARHAYAQAKDGPAGEANPTGVHEAEQALHAAEAAHEEDPGSSREKHNAYIATRKAQLAVAQGNEHLARTSQKEAAEAHRESLEKRTQELSSERTRYADQLEEAQRELSSVRSDLSETDANLNDSRATLEQREAELASRVKELEATEKARKEAEERAERARKELEEIASVRDDAGRLVISLSGAVLFKTASSDLLDMAKRRLDTVADAIEGYGSGDIIVEGHTDSRGTEQYNLDLSQKRAASVREYLVSKGIPGNRVSPKGRGEAEPIASNDTAEGRANNRRVEIIVNPDEPSQSTSSRSTPEKGTDAEPRASHRPGSSQKNASR